MDFPCTILTNILCVFEISHNKMFRKLKKKKKQNKTKIDKTNSNRDQNAGYLWEMW